jgi:hypothetical protein
MRDKRRDRCGEPFQDDFTESRGASRERIADAQLLLTLDPDTDSEEADAFCVTFCRQIRALQ